MTTTRQQKTMSEAMTALRVALDDAISAAKRDDESAYLAGVGDGEDGYVAGYTRITETLGAGLQEVAYLRTHTHAYSDDDYCTICCADGRV